MPNQVRRTGARDKEKLERKIFEKDRRQLLDDRVVGVARSGKVGQKNILCRGLSSKEDSQKVLTKLSCSVTGGLQ